MIYLDYSATTPPDKKVLDCFVRTARENFANANSIHEIGRYSNRIITEKTRVILQFLGVPDDDLVFTSGATEANNLAIKGLALRKNRPGNHMITTTFEHSSVTSVFGYLQRLGFEVDLVDPDENGQIAPETIEALIRDDTFLVSVCGVDGETGVRQDVEAIGRMLRKYPQVYFHSDLTQAIGKVPVSLKDIDLVSFSAHKIYGLKGIGGLVKKPDVVIEPVVHGGKSTTVFRGGTPPTELIASLAEAVTIAIENLVENRDKVININKYLKERLEEIPGIVFNSNAYSIPQIMNISVMKASGKALQKALSDRDIYVSTQTACSSDKGYSDHLIRIYNDSLRASTSLRISLSHLTSVAEINTFVSALKAELRP